MCNYFDFGLVVHREMSFRNISYAQLWWPFCSAVQSHLDNFGTAHYEEHSSEIILNLDQWYRRCHLKTFLIYSSGGHLVWQISTI